MGDIQQDFVFFSAGVYWLDSHNFGDMRLSHEVCATKSHPHTHTHTRLMTLSNITAPYFSMPIQVLHLFPGDVQHCFKEFPSLPAALSHRQDTLQEESSLVANLPLLISKVQENTGQAPHYGFLCKSSPHKWCGGRQSGRFRRPWPSLCLVGDQPEMEIPTKSFGR